MRDGVNRRGGSACPWMTMIDLMNRDHKVCSYCGETKPLKEFKRRSGRGGGAAGRRGMCRSCRAARGEGAQAAGPESAKLSGAQAGAPAGGLAAATEPAAAGSAAAAGTTAAAGGKKRRSRGRRRRKSHAPAALAGAGASASAAPEAAPPVEEQGSPVEGAPGSDLPEGAVLLPDKPKKKRRPRRRKRKPAADPAAAGQAGEAPQTPQAGQAEPAAKARRQAVSAGRPGAAVSPPPQPPVAAAAEPSSAAEPAAAGRKRSRRRKKKAPGPPLAGAAGLPDAPPEPRAKAEPLLRSRPHTTGGKLDVHDPAALRPTRQGIIRMRGRTDKGRGWYQEIDLEMAVTLVREHAAVLINPHTIRRLYSNKDFRRYILTRDHYTCYFCGEYGDTIDHLVPRAKGGHSTPDNCVCACSLCNRYKADKDVDVFLKESERISFDPF